MGDAIGCSVDVTWDTGADSMVVSVIVALCGKSAQMLRPIE